MLSDYHLNEIRRRITTAANESDAPGKAVAEDAKTLIEEVARLQQTFTALSERVERQLSVLEADMLKLDAENDRLRVVRDSTYFERDACISLLAQLAHRLGLATGTTRAEVMQENMDGKTSLQVQNRVVVDLPSGQVSWDFLDDDAHLFQALPEYGKTLEQQTIRDVYTKVMNPGLA